MGNEPQQGRAPEALSEEQLERAAAGSLVVHFEVSGSVQSRPEPATGHTRSFLDTTREGETTGV